MCDLSQLSLVRSRVTYYVTPFILIALFCVSPKATGLSGMLDKAAVSTLASEFYACLGERSTQS